MTGNYQTFTTHTVLLNLKIVCHLAELNSIETYGKTIDFFLLLWITTY